MPIMCWVSKFTKALFFLLLGLGWVSHVHAGTETFWVKNKSGQVHLSMTDGTACDVKLNPDVDGVFYDRNKHELGEDEVRFAVSGLTL